ncbi:hypothetical protein MJO28_014150 [Puccinia striiformis f. sp. tritici]|uniref:Uncharacterized protein n=4 Tax=Puccinia striiformis TaxID=27350 RepID=A0A0L0W497_9BASI|nr:hypothetical protein Pst134EA_026617 [Puccinia striiformis f. sp. tritici]KAI9616358.1 hypothetical protein H4Q26_010748 [Puccinia striiformis f. sp. tritici PST-130]KNF06318.1 hypothetical protein PSTG_00823 [Puccinia striiformis f. sp. tritici PST-78]POV98343.1 hypothetical protein PSHT_14078 [Puccinia striiformis]KAH9442818.1 hypothetical protein Pst134EB_027172 [Puccinia striiformis f. sp. tritici]KAH9442825.1 hypothetical protein Pst134EB_027178 [Puccinia striiformis f. sp. tritici]
MVLYSTTRGFSFKIPCSRILLYTFVLVQLCNSVRSSSCYYDSFTGRTVCDGLSYGARLAIAAAITILGALALTGISFVVRKRFYGARTPPPVSAGYYGPPQTSYPPNVAYVQQQQPNLYPGAPPPVPAYAPPVGPPPPGYNPDFYKQGPPQPPQHP